MSEERQIMDAIEAYLEAIKTGNEDMFNRAFRSDSVVIFAGESDDDKLVTPIIDFAERVKQRHEAGTYVEEIPLEGDIEIPADVNFTVLTILSPTAAEEPEEEEGEEMEEEGVEEAAASEATTEE